MKRKVPHIKVRLCAKSIKTGLLYSFSFGCPPELTDDVQEGIAREDAGVGFGAALCADGACDVGEPAQDVEAVGHPGPTCL